MTPGWVLVIPVKGPGGKSRLEHPDRAELASAIALDTLEVACRARNVSDVVLVCSDEEFVANALRLDPGHADLWVVPDPGAGLNAAIAAGLDAVEVDQPRAVMLGDLPALDPADLDGALARAEAHARAFTPDAEGTGTTLVTARPGEHLAPAFGADSAARHAASGFVRLEVRADSTLRRDVDTAEQLRAAASLGLGPRTSALL
ncbi:2-phospho-L-lactate guanylyltransferase [Microbacterium stercoris]|uniref:2-phospho-L-lactate guanylyltransferase n=1 Tax=Microbacterium stercoris TaxID=2820289 RepID=A0A939QQ09_9MICO|nr:2-phospho-L-lactate guanylyltransferase [Microbacterium stercoris]MBO3662546.1 2-phospho-L-lactate guanylyltransferase [Microbacterium stercoris]